ncbi:DUF3347 domain-containing protein [Niabella aurantiaca]|uniref:DUF3347 domain-containing protein n=1 Tax=Niabella aurantiaca TaxID=379900 RepID=UPI000399C538|nr:DUF3347 domain-containing protein [Niabella aurantiaca]
MQSIKNISLGLFMTLITSSIYAGAQISNAKTATVTIRGNSRACKTQIEKAGTQKKQAQLTWDPSTQKAALVYNSHTTTKDAVLRRVALAGFDNESYNAPVTAYQALPEGCRYKGNITAMHPQKDTCDAPMEQHRDHAAANATVSKLESLYQSYFSIQQALVRSDAKTVAQKAGELAGLVRSVKMGELSAREHNVWMSVMKKLDQQAAALKGASGIEKQRAAFASLTETLYPLIKASGSPYKVYYNHCPMYHGGAYWLSKEQGIKNPYYGSKMLTCGSTKETLQ